jgi:xylitol oxidase
MGFTPSSGKELQTEYFVPVQRSYEAIRAVEQLQDKIVPHLLVSEIRSVAADELWMSPCYRQACTAIHFTWQQQEPAVRQLLPLIEAALAPFGARPHWGKLFTQSHRDIKQLYTKLTDFQQLLKNYDPEGRFRNNYLDTVVFGGDGNGGAWFSPFVGER